MTVCIHFVAPFAPPVSGQASFHLLSRQRRELPGKQKIINILNNLILNEFSKIGKSNQNIENE